MRGSTAQTSHMSSINPQKTTCWHMPSIVIKSAHKLCTKTDVMQLRESIPERRHFSDYSHPSKLTIALYIYITNLVAWIPTHHTCLLPAKLRSTVSLPKTMQRELFCQLLRAKTDSMRQENAAPTNQETWLLQSSSEGYVSVDNLSQFCHVWFKLWNLEI